jgi:hypothetical protein
MQPIGWQFGTSLKGGVNFHSDPGSVSISVVTSPTFQTSRGEA